MVIEGGYTLILIQKMKYPLIMVVAIYHLIRSPPLDLKAGEMMNWSQRMARGRPKSMEMCVLLCNSLVHHLHWQLKILHAVAAPWNC
jgi:hypothetical protein